MSGPIERKENETSGTDSSNQVQTDEVATLTMTHEEFAACLQDVPTEYLVSILEKDERMLPSVRLVIKRRYCFEFFQLSTNYDPHLTPQNIPWSAKLLKYFGNEINCLKMVYDEEHRRVEHFVEKLVAENCSQSLKKLCLVNANQYSMLEIEQPFANSTEIEFNTGTVCSPLMSMWRILPKLETVKLINVLLDVSRGHGFFGAEFNNLTIKAIHIRNIQSKKSGTGHFNYVARFIRRCWKLEHLSIANQENVDELLNRITRQDPERPCLQLKLNLNKPVGTKASHFEKLKSLSISGLDQELKISVDHLEELCLSGRSFTINCLKIIENCRNVQALHLDGRWENDHVAAEFIKLLETLPKLRELKLFANLSLEQINDLVRNCKALVKVTLLSTINVQDDEERLTEEEDEKKEDDGEENDEEEDDEEEEDVKEDDEEEIKIDAMKRLFDNITPNWCMSEWFSLEGVAVFEKSSAPTN